MKKYRLEIILFIVNAIYMIMELAASRILSPYFGSTNLVWTSVIGIILLGSSIGNYIGGKLADKDINDNYLKNILIVLGIFILIIPIIQEFILRNISLKIENTLVGAVLSSVLLFFIPTLLFGLFSPIILTLRTKYNDKVGSTSGRIYAISTIGSLFGTFIGGFVLLPNFGSNELLFILSLIVFLLILLIEELKLKEVVIVVIFSILSIGLYFYYDYVHRLQIVNVLNGEKGAYVSYDTEYSHVVIKNMDNAIAPYRQMLFGTTIESMSYIEEDKYNDIVSSYIYYYDTMFVSNKEINDVLMIGGGGYAYPKHYISTYKDKKMDVIEIDEDVTKLAEEYFFLDKLFEEYDSNRERLNIIEEDGRVYLNKNDKKYDAILNDAFTGIKPVPTLTTIEAIYKIYNSLNDGGLYLTNIIGSIEGENSGFLYAEVNTLKQVFKNVYVIPCTSVDRSLLQNFMVIATDNKLYLMNNIKLDISDDTIVLTDNYAPIELLAKYTNKK